MSYKIFPSKSEIEELRKRSIVLHENYEYNPSTETYEPRREYVLAEWNKILDNSIDCRR